MMKKGLLPSTSQALVYLLGFVFVSEVVCLAVGVALSRAEAAVLLISAFGLAGYIFGARVASMVALLSLVAALLAVSVYDDSFDGQWYHQGAVAALASGWNPLREPFDAKYLVDDGIGFGPTIGLWITHYPKSSWILEAVIFKLSNSLQMAKMVNLIGIFAALGTSFGLFSRYLRAGPALLLALVAGLNPISIAQVFTFYNDGLSASLMLVLAASLASLAISGKWRDVSLPAVAITLLANLKFSILAMTVVLCIFGAAAIAIRFRASGVPKIAALAAVGVVATVLIGWSPYVQNLVGYGHPFYPVMGPNAVDIMSGITPAAIREAGQFTKFVIGNFSSPGSGEESIRWIPDRTSMGWTGLADTRLGGFGVLSLAIAVISLAGTLVCKARSRAGAWGLFAILAIAVSVAINPENWWARYVPQLWILPLSSHFR